MTRKERRPLHAPELTKRHVNRVTTRLIRMTARYKQNYGWTSWSWLENQDPEKTFWIRCAVLLIGALWREVQRLRVELKEVKKAVRDASRSR